MEAVALTAYAGRDFELPCGCVETEAVKRWIDAQARFRREFVLVIVPKPGCPEHSREEGKPWAS